MKKLLLQHCQKSAGHHADYSKLHAKAAEAHSKLAEACGDGEDDKRDLHQELADIHKELSASHADRAEHFAELHDDMKDEPDTDKAATSDIAKAVTLAVREALGDKIVPDGIQRTIPAGISLIPRSGAPDPNIIKGLDPEVAAILGDLG